MSQYLGTGNGSNGSLTVSSTVTDSLVDSSCSGTSGTTSLSATAAFVAGDIIRIQQIRGTGVGNWELNQVASYVAGTITTTNNLDYTYTDSGASQAYVFVVKQYTDMTINSGVRLDAKQWDGNLGSTLCYMIQGDVNLNGTLSAGLLGPGEGYSTNNQGFRGGTVGDGQGEGTGGDRNTASTAANGSGGGGGTNDTNSGAGGGGHATAGANGVGSGVGTGGGTSGSTDLVTMTPGGAGGNGGQNGNGQGGYGGGMIHLIYGGTLTVNNSTGLIKAQGSDGQSGSTPGSGGGGGAGGSLLLQGKTSAINTDRLFVQGGEGGNSGGGTGDGGDGGDGRIRIETCNLTGSISASLYGSYTTSIGGHSFCGLYGGMIV